MKTKRVIAITIIATLSFFLFQCKKGQNEGIFENYKSELNVSLAKLSNSYSGVSYNDELGILEFSTLSAYHSAVSGLNGELEELEFDY